MKIKEVIFNINVYFSRIFSILFYYTAVNFLAIFLIFNAFLRAKYESTTNKRDNIIEIK